MATNTNEGAVWAVIRRIRPTAITIAVILAALAWIIISTGVDYAETIVGVIVGVLAGSFDKLIKESDESQPAVQRVQEQPATPRENG